MSSSLSLYQSEKAPPPHAREVTKSIVGKSAMCGYKYRVGLELGSLTETRYTSIDMFDWNDEAIANIIWGEAGDSGDHIVPYPDKGEQDGHKKFQNQEPMDNKPTEHNLSGAKLDFQGIRPERSAASKTNGQSSASVMASWPNVATSEVAETGLSSLNDEMFSDSVLNGKYFADEIREHIRRNSARHSEWFVDSEQLDWLDGESEPYVNLEGQELSDFGKYGWENIDSFDDIDRMFSNADPIFPSIALGNPDEIWSSSNNKKRGLRESFGSSTGALETSEVTRVKSKYGRSGQSVDLSFESMYDSVSHTFQQKSELLSIAGDGAYNREHNLAVEMKTRPVSSHLAAEKIFTLNEFAHKKKARGKAKGKSSQHLNSRCSVPLSSASGFYTHHLTAALPQVCLPFSQSQLDEGAETFNYQPMQQSYMTPSAFTYYTNPFAPTDLSPCYQPAFPGYDVTSTDVDSAGKQHDSPGKAPTMTPREKIEKLRRRQQMQAILAIQNQLQQFGNQVSSNAIAQNNSLESLNKLKSGPTYEVNNLRTHPSLDVPSSIEQDESSTLSAAADGYSVEEAVLQQLQDMISKLDVPVCIAIRDSLFRLATSALQRQKTNYLNSSCTCTMDQHGAAVKEEHVNSKREVNATDSETDTNPMDRAVAHLLFHRLLSGKHPETPESSMSTKLTIEQQEPNGADQGVDSGRSSKISFDFCSHGLGNPCRLPADCMVMSCPSPNYGAVVAGALVGTSNP
ncbi:hypothetical protein MLD38_038231 [Melastoma candidum]|uniref:Uncharacterized protein n=1 Tax=Melastoma candidum TaxID=119954 RepID=A0ACB9KZ46_9MYRT|nr:hypothetical protein MLD38_038231 [Melastoma candidum]